jgi:putative transposase
MRLEPDAFYHVYNRGHNRQRIFFSVENYRYFKRKLKKHIASTFPILAYCLMPNHFHLLIENRQPSDQPYHFNKKWSTVLSSYALAINRQEGRTGALFQERTKMQEVMQPVQFGTGKAAQEASGLWHCWAYILRNPREAELVEQIGAWPFSSARELLDLPVETPLIDRDRLQELFEMKAAEIANMVRAL